MINQKRKKNKMKSFILISLIIIFSLPINANETVCKTYDIKCKTNKFINETKEFQKKGLDDGKNQIDDTKNKINKTKNKILEIIPKKKKINVY